MSYSLSNSFSRRLQILLVLLVVVVLVLAFGQILQNRGADVAGTETASFSPRDLPADDTLDQTVARLQEQLRQNPENSDVYAQLGLARLQQVRETGDAALYLQAETAFAEALSRDPDQQQALLGEGMLALARHDFAEGLVYGERVRELNPYNADALSILVDGYVELGQYDAAIEQLEIMVNLKPGLASFSRISYMRELHGDIEGAKEAMAQAADTAVPGSESWLWTRTQLGNLYFNSGDWKSAGMIYEDALALQPDYAYALAGKARVLGAQGNTTEAIAIYGDLVVRYPLAEFAIAMGELLEATGDMEGARKQYGLVEVIQQLNENAGMNVDAELALFDADHGDTPTETVTKAEIAYERHPSVTNADVLAWAYYQNRQFDEAWAMSEQALRLGSMNALWWFHAGMISDARGDGETATAYLQKALDINPAFSFVYVPVVEGMLAE